MMNWTETGRSTASAADRVVVNVASAADLLADIEARFARGQGYSVATLNLDHVVKLHRDPDFARAYARHSHVTADGHPIVWLSRLAGQKVSLTPGSDLLEPLCALAARTGMRVALFGSTQEVLDKVAERLAVLHPGLQVVAAIAPRMGFDPTGAEAEDARRALAEARADLCLLALGAPKQEKFAIFAAEALPHCGFVSIGASLDFVIGHQVRAPRLVRMLAAEWLWRLALSPARLAGRYAACFAILPRLTRAALASRTMSGRNQTS